MSDQDDWNFAGADDAKAKIRAAVRYLLKGATGPARDFIALEILEIMRQLASGLPPDDGLPGGTGSWSSSAGCGNPFSNARALDASIKSPAV